MTEALPLNCVGVLGAKSFVGQSIIPLLAGSGIHVSAFTRQTIAQESGLIKWITLPAHHQIQHLEPDSSITHWICVSPIWVLHDFLSWIKSMGAKRVVALSSTSRFTKTDSSDVAEQALAQRLAETEQQFIEWAEASGIEWIILRPTLIYGLGQDKNICEIARFIRRFSFFPVFGKAQGLRQPVHVQDVARACFAALKCTSSNKAYNISGGETLAYREMVFRVFKALGRTPRLLTVPLTAFRMAVAPLRLLPRFRKWTPAMAERMNQDLVFNHAEAEKDLDFSPRPFDLNPTDLPN